MDHARPDASAQPCLVVIFGASGDLVSRKLIPALYDMFRKDRLPSHFAVMGVSRTKMTDESFREHLQSKAPTNPRTENADKWDAFAQRVHYFAGDATAADDYPAMLDYIRTLADQHQLLKDHPGAPDKGEPRHGIPNILLYLSVAPGLVIPIVEQIGAAGIICEQYRLHAGRDTKRPWQRVVIEKPVGHDLKSAIKLNEALADVFAEEQTYRIDHYLGKELVQNILVMRFANTIFEPIWNNRYVDHIQVTAAESVGVGRRAGNFYDKAGATRDMIQSHLLQVLALVAMEPPSEYGADQIRREKVKVLEAIGEVNPRSDVALGHYGASHNEHDDDAGLAYTELEGVDPSRNTETFGALRLNIDNWRWTGVPVYVRSGKKLARKLTEVVVQFKQPPANLFRQFEPFASGGIRPSNRIVMNIAPEEGVKMRFEAKVPGPHFRIGSVRADMDYQSFFNSAATESYGPLLVDVMRGDRTLFQHRGEVESTWRVVEPVVSMTPELREQEIETYAPGSWGPRSSDKLLAEDDREWHNPETKGS